MEALSWLKTNKNEYCFASNKFKDKRQILALVKKLYKLGAVKIEIDNIMDEPERIEDEGGPYADTLLVYLPKNKTERLELKAAMFKTRPDEIGSSKTVLNEINWNKDDMIRLWWD